MIYGAARPASRAVTPYLARYKRRVQDWTVGCHRVQADSFQVSERELLSFVRILDSRSLVNEIRWYE